jgi:hypothetical protein
MLARREMGRVVSFQTTLLAAARGCAPDTFWLGKISAATFVQIVRDLLQLLTHRQDGEGSMLAKRMVADRFRYACPLPRGIEYPALYTLDHRARLMVMAALTQVLLGNRAAHFRPFGECDDRLLVPLTVNHQLSFEELQFLRIRAAAWPEHLRLRILQHWVVNLPTNCPVPPRKRGDFGQSNSHI